MNTYFTYLWDKLRGSYWVIPAICSVVAALLSWAAPLADDALIGAGWDGPPWIHTTTETARTTLSTIAGAMIAATGTVFSITIVTLSLTSQQFGPRLLRRFLDDVVTQTALGVFLASSLYGLLALRSVSQYADDVEALHLPALVGVALAVVSMIMLIVFIDHVTTVIQAPHIVASVAQDLDDAVDRIFPEAEEDDETRRVVPDELAQKPVEVCSSVEGYLQAIAFDELTELGARENLLVRLSVRPGNFVAKGSLLARVELLDGGRPPKDLEESVNAAFIAGVRRTPRQDVGCAVNELVEVAVRALSPGINDPFTAMSCVDRLGASLGRLAERSEPAPCRLDEAGVVRVVESPESFEGLLDDSLDQIRQSSESNVAVTIRILEALEVLLERVSEPSRRKAILRHAQLVAAHRENIFAEADRDEILKPWERIERAVNA